MWNFDKFGPIPTNMSPINEITTRPNQHDLDRFSQDRPYQICEYIRVVKSNHGLVLFLFVLVRVVGWGGGGGCAGGGGSIVFICSLSFLSVCIYILCGCGLRVRLALFFVGFLSLHLHVDDRRNDGHLRWLRMAALQFMPTLLGDYIHYLNLRRQCSAFASECDELILEDVPITSGLAWSRQASETLGVAQFVPSQLPTSTCLRNLSSPGDSWSSSSDCTIIAILHHFQSCWH